MVPRRWSFAVCMMVFAGACTPVERGQGPGAKTSVKPADVPGTNHTSSASYVVTTLQTRDHEVTVYATDAGPQFTVAAAGGTVLAERLSNAEFRASFPGLHQRYDSAFAADGTRVDASLTLRDPTEPPAR